MALATVYSRAARGLESILVSVEVHIGSGMPNFHIVGMPEKAVRESKHRVRAVITHSQFEFPAHRITVNLAPVDLPKEGGRFDLPIALGIVIASGQVSSEMLKEYEFVSELEISGALRSVRGVLSAGIAATKKKHTLVIPAANIAEASLISDANIYGATHFLNVCEHLKTGNTLNKIEPRIIETKVASHEDFAEVVGQHHAVRALEIAAAGGHNCLMVGSPGTGKTMLASRLLGILPLLDEKSALEVIAIRSICGGKVSPKDFYRRPFRAPHHSATAAALLGGGSDLHPGEITRAHHGVLFLDELPEFQRHSLEALREPLELGIVRLSRASGSVEYPAQFQLIAAMNPCPDGADVDEYGRCPCNAGQLQRYYARLSAPFLDRIDIHIRVPRIRFGQGEIKNCEHSAAIRARVADGHQLQIRRQSVQNARMNVADMKRYCTLMKSDETLLYQAVERLSLSMRASHRILKIARTIADLAQSESITRTHLLEALSYRSMDKLFKI